MICWNCYHKMKEYFPKTGGTGKQWLCPSCHATECGTPPLPYRKKLCSEIHKNEKLEFSKAASELTGISEPKNPEKLLWSKLLSWYNA